MANEYLESGKKLIVDQETIYILRRLFDLFKEAKRQGRKKRAKSLGDTLALWIPHLLIEIEQLRAGKINKDSKDR